MSSTPANSPLRAALLATSSGIGCHHRLRADFRLGVELLDQLGLVRPIRQRIPDCTAHGCPLLTGCRFAADFAEARAGRSGKKYRLAPLGERALTDDAILRQLAAAARDLALPRRILVALADGALTIFALNTTLLEAGLASLARDGDPGAAAFTRGELAAALTLLAGLGAIASDGYRVALAALTMVAVATA